MVSGDTNQYLQLVESKADLLHPEVNLSCSDMDISIGSYHGPDVEWQNENGGIPAGLEESQVVDQDLSCPSPHTVDIPLSSNQEACQDNLLRSPNAFQIDAPSLLDDNVDLDAPQDIAVNEEKLVSSQNWEGAVGLNDRMEKITLDVERHDDIQTMLGENRLADPDFAVGRANSFGGGSCDSTPLPAPDIPLAGTDIDVDVHQPCDVNEERPDNSENSDELFGWRSQSTPASSPEQQDEDNNIEEEIAENQAIDPEVARTSPPTGQDDVHEQQYGENAVATVSVDSPAGQDDEHEPKDDAVASVNSLALAAVSISEPIEKALISSESDNTGNVDVAVVEGGVREANVVEGEICDEPMQETFGEEDPNVDQVSGDARNDMGEVSSSDGAGGSDL